MIGSLGIPGIPKTKVRDPSGVLNLAKLALSIEAAKFEASFAKQMSRSHNGNNRNPSPGDSLGITSLGIRCRDSIGNTLCAMGIAMEGDPRDRTRA